MEEERIKREILADRQKDIELKKWSLELKEEERRLSTKHLDTETSYISTDRRSKTVNI